MKKRFLSVILWMVTLALIFSPIQPIKAKGDTGKEKQCITQTELQRKEEMRRLWADHAIWTRSYIVSAVSGVEDQQKVLARLLKNQDDIGNAVKPFYGNAAGDKLAALLRNHILIGGKVVDAAKSGNQTDLKKYNDEWYRNADDIAQFLSSANPNWNQDELKSLLHTHLKLVTDTVTARLKKNWDAEIIAFDTGVDHLMKIADTLTEGIVKQFPDRFK